LQKKHGKDRNLPRIDGFEASKEYQKVEEQTSKNARMYFPGVKRKEKLNCLNTSSTTHSNYAKDRN
jgi:hypothetical protein